MSCLEHMSNENPSYSQTVRYILALGFMGEQVKNTWMNTQVKQEIKKLKKKKNTLKQCWISKTFMYTAKSLP